MSKVPKVKMEKDKLVFEENDIDWDEEYCVYCGVAYSHEHICKDLIDVLFEEQEDDLLETADKEEDYYESDCD